MIKVTYISADGTQVEAQGEAGDSVMNLAISAGVDGIVAECGGSMMCATCHCFVDEAWAEKAGPRVDGEQDMLECATTELTAASRLSCQIKLSPALDGLVVHVPESQ